MELERDETVKDRRITKPQHIRQLLTEQINLLRSLKPQDNREAMDITRTITYASNTSLMAMRDGEVLEKLEKVEKMMEKLIKDDEY